ncbi:hypothetical protein GOV05_05250, partial [Candidatus Woesearchaeota archaeon]|nr:hypothetical protein [Candidatus Woesearchaeota archaeon]
VKKEEGSYRYYHLLSKKVDDEVAREVFEMLAKEELIHKNMIKNEIKRIS